MLANGATLGYKKKSESGTSYTDLKGLKEIPEWGNDPEKVDDTCLTDKFKRYEVGIGDLGDIKYKFRYDNSKTDSPYRVLKAAQDAGEVLSFKEELKDGSVTEFDAELAVKRTGGGVNGVIDFEVTMIIQSEIKNTDPA